MTIDTRKVRWAAEHVGRFEWEGVRYEVWVTPYTKQGCVDAYVRCPGKMVAHHKAKGHGYDKRGHALMMVLRETGVPWDIPIEWVWGGALSRYPD